MSLWPIMLYNLRYGIHVKYMVNLVNINSVDGVVMQIIVRITQPLSMEQRDIVF